VCNYVKLSFFGFVWFRVGVCDFVFEILLKFVDENVCIVNVMRLGKVISFLTKETKTN
jgi:hypothetical protein